MGQWGLLRGHIHAPIQKRAHPSKEGHSCEALSVICAAQLGQEVSEQASQVVIGMGHQGTGMGRDGHSPSAINSLLQKLPPTTLQPLPVLPPPAPHLAKSRTPSRWVWAPASFLQPPACSMHVTTMRLPSPVSRAFKASTVQLGGGSRRVG